MKKYLCFLLGISLLALSSYGYGVFLLCDNARKPDKKEWFSKAGYSQIDFSWFLVATFSFPIGYACFIVSLVQIFKDNIHISMKYIFLYMLFGLSSWIASIAYGMVADIFDCGIIYCGKYALKRPHVSHARVFIGMTYFSVVMFTLLIITYMLVTIHYKQLNDSFSLVSSRMHVTIDNPSSGLKTFKKSSNQNYKTNVLKSFNNFQYYKKYIIYIFTFVLLFPSVLFFTMLLPTSWKRFTPMKILEFQSNIPNLKNGFYWKYDFDINNNNNSNIIMKLYPDVVMYYFFIYMMVLSTFIFHCIQPIQYVLFQRFSTFPISLKQSMIEIFIISSTTILLLCEFYYYFFYIPILGKSTKSRSEQAAVAIGQTANIVFALLLLPITRNSVWSTLFNVPSNAFILFHQLLGYVFVFLIALHTVFWGIVYYEHNSFPADFLRVPTVVHPNNPTTHIAQYGSIVMFFIMFLPAIYPSIRRNNYEIFYYLHHFFIVMFYIILWHATRSWYFILPSLLLWVSDHFLRLLNCIGYQMGIVSVTIYDNHQNNHSNYVQITYKDRYNRMNGCHTDAGQYMYINIPHLSTFEWHPFTISSEPGASSITHTIKCIQYHQHQHHNNNSKNKNEWTRKLFDFFQTNQKHPNILKDITLIVDGPYGISFPYKDYTKILLIAGGIGITPYASFIRSMEKDIRLNANTNTNTLNVPHIQLIWMVKYLSDIEPFQDLVSSLL